MAVEGRRGADVSTSHLVVPRARAYRGCGVEVEKFKPNQSVVFRQVNPISGSGGVAELKSSQTPVGAIAKVAGMSEISFAGPGRCIGIDLGKPCNDLNEAERLPRGRVVQTLAYPFTLPIFADQTGRARKRVMTRAGGKAEIVSHADI